MDFTSVIFVSDFMTEVSLNVCPRVPLSFTQWLCLFVCVRACLSVCVFLCLPVYMLFRIRFFCLHYFPKTREMCPVHCRQLCFEQCQFTLKCINYHSWSCLRNISSALAVSNSSHSDVWWCQSGTQVLLTDWDHTVLRVLSSLHIVQKC